MNINKEYLDNKVKNALWESIELLAIEEGNLKERLKQIFIGGPLYMIDINLFSDKLKPKWQEIEKMITKYPATYDLSGKLLLSNIEATLIRIKNKTASRIAKLIVELYYEINTIKK